MKKYSQMNKYSISITAFIIISVSGSLQALAYYDVNNPEKSSDMFCSDYGYCFTPPLETNARIGTNDILRFSTSGTYAYEKYYIQPYHLLLATCAPLYLGEREEDIAYIDNIGDKAAWTKMQIHHYADWSPERVCTPSTVGCSDIEISEGTCITSSATYAFCSEQDSKTVFICLTQQTDNPEMAEEIFSTFSWIDDSNNIALQYLVNNGIVSGYPDGTFRTYNLINRAEFTKIVVGALPPSLTLPPVEEGNSPSSLERGLGGEVDAQNCFPDVPNDAWFASYVCTARRFEIVNGYPDGTFRPADNINTAEAAKIVVEAFDLSITSLDSAQDGNWYQPYWNALDEINAIPSSVTTPDQLLTRGEMTEIIFNVMTRVK